jgi:hypothetical protein
MTNDFVFSALKCFFQDFSAALKKIPEKSNMSLSRGRESGKISGLDSGGQRNEDLFTVP